MAERDYKLGPDGDLIIRDGDFVFDEALDDDVDLLLLTNPGEVKADPLAGVGMLRMLRGEVSQEEIKKKVKLQLERDGKNYEEIREGIKTRTIG